MWCSPGIYTWTPALSFIHLWFSNNVRSMFFYLYLQMIQTCLYLSGKDVQALSEKLNGDMENIRQWLCCNKLSLNVSKTHYMVFAPKKNKHVDDLNINIQNTNIERVSVTKFLGVMIDAHLSWKSHSEYTCKKYRNVWELSLKHGRS